MFVPFNILPVVTAASKEMGRYAIKGVHFRRTEEGRAVAVATDGRRLLSVSWSEESPQHAKFPWNGEQKTRPGFSATVPVEAVVRISRLTATRGGASLGGFLIEEGEDALGTVINIHAADLATTSAVVKVSVVDGTFPPYKTVIPAYEIIQDQFSSDTPKRGVRIGVNAKFLAELVTAMSKMCPSDSNAIFITIPTDPTKAIRLDAEDVSKTTQATAVIMPVTTRGTN